MLYFSVFLFLCFLFYFEMMPSCVSSCFSVPPVWFSLPVFLCSSPHLFLIPPLVFLCPCQFVLSVLFHVTPSWSVVPCVSCLVCFCFWFLASLSDLNFPSSCTLFELFSCCFCLFHYLFCILDPLVFVFIQLLFNKLCSLFIHFLSPVCVCIRVLTLQDQQLQ